MTDEAKGHNWLEVHTVDALEAEIGMLREKLSDALAGGLPHLSDCAVYQAPAYEPGPCTCGVGVATDDSAYDLVRKLREHNGWSRDVTNADAVSLVRSFIASARGDVAQAVGDCGGWQTLESAPLDPLRDPPLVMLWVSDGGHKGEGTHAFGRCYRSHDGTVRGVASGFSGDWKIKYWKPLGPGPAPPSAHRRGPDCTYPNCRPPGCNCTPLPSTNNPGAA